MDTEPTVSHAELILGGQRSGKSRRAEDLAQRWLALGQGRDAVLLATARAWDDEMRSRIERHRVDRASRVPALRTVEEPLALGGALRRHSTTHTLLVVDCLTLWLTNLLMPGDGVACGTSGQVDDLTVALSGLPGPVVLVSNEIGLGVIPLGHEVRHFVDELGRLNQAVAQVCGRVTLMVAGCPVAVKG